MQPPVVTGEYRRGKTALFLIACVLVSLAPRIYPHLEDYWFDYLRTLIPACILAIGLGGYGLRAVLRDKPIFTFTEFTTNDKSSSEYQSLPHIDILIAARDEEAVLERLVDRLSYLIYPEHKLKIWIIDDGSQDRSPILLEELSRTYQGLNIIRRSRSAGGGKSGALNEALAKSQGEWLLILDADAQLQEDVLLRALQYAKHTKLSAVQLRKAVINPEQNLLTRFQSMEMAMDAIIQQGRFPSGVVELRGNGQFLKRSSLDQCGGFNEDTVTDDLDLSFKFLIEKALVGILWDPPVQEEAVESWGALWKQRQRWAEGGLQRFFDYWWFLLFSNQITLSKRRDLVCFFLLQYALPVVSFVDGILAILTRSLPVYWPFSLIAFTVSGVAYWRGCSRRSEGPILPRPNLINISLAIFYLSHWFLVIPWVAVKMALLPKKLVWAKTLHRGQQSARI